MFLLEENLKSCFAFHFLALKHYFGTLKIGQNDPEIVVEGVLPGRKTSRMVPGLVGEAEGGARSGKQPVRYACRRETRARGQRYLLQPEEVEEAVVKVKVQEDKGCWGGSSFHPFFQDCVRGQHLCLAEVERSSSHTKTSKFWSLLTLFLR